jgi:hypothetical protein
VNPERPETLYDLLRAIVERTGWRTEAEAKRYTELLHRLEEMATLGDLTARITTQTEVRDGHVEREDVRQLRGDLLGERPRLAAGDD